MIKLDVLACESDVLQISTSHAHDALWWAGLAARCKGPRYKLPTVVRYLILADHVTS